MTPWVLVLALAAATPFNDAFDRATEAFTHGDYATAIQGYEQLVAEGVHAPAVFYNLGNAYFLSGRLGPAIANYERTLRLQPGFEDASRNLDLCIARTHRQLARPLPPDWEQSLLFWHYRLGPGAAGILAALCWVGCWLLLGVRQWKPLRFTRAAVAICLLGVVAFGASAWVKTHPALMAVASAERIPVYYANSEASGVRYELFEGDRVEVAEKREGGWVRVRTVTGEQGWTHREWLTLVGPPYSPAPDPATMPPIPPAASAPENPA